MLFLAPWQGVPRGKTHANNNRLRNEAKGELRKRPDFKALLGSYWAIIQNLLVSHNFLSRAFMAAAVSASFLLWPSPSPSSISSQMTLETKDF